jgi:hypothetical protein
MILTLKEGFDHNLEKIDVTLFEGKRGELTL